MSKFDEAIALYKSEMTGKLGMTNIDEALLIAITKSLGPSIYNKDASIVSCSDKKELERVKNNFLIRKLGLPDSPQLDKVMQEVCQEMGSSNPVKYRPIFYYKLTKKLDRDSKFV